MDFEHGNCKGNDGKMAGRPGTKGLRCRMCGGYYMLGD